MIKKIILLLVAVVVLSGCVNPQTAKAPIVRGGVLKSSDGAMTFEPKIQAGERNIGSVDSLSFLIDPQDNTTLYIGSMKKGIFVSYDAGEQWQQIQFPPSKVYGLAINPYDNNILYATGVLEKRARIFKSENAGEDWEEIYVEPSGGTVIISLTLDRQNPNVLYAGSTTGMIIQSRDGGKTWINKYKADGPISDIQVDPYNSQNLYAVHYEREILISRDTGNTFENISKSRRDDEEDKVRIEGKIFSLAIDRSQPGIIFVGTDNGIYKGFEYGATWQTLNVIDSSKNLPIYAIAVSPFDSAELIYSVGSAIYKTSDSGTQWYVYELQAQASVSALTYDVKDPGVVYLGLRERK